MKAGLGFFVLFTIKPQRHAVNDITAVGTNTVTSLSGSTFTISGDIHLGKVIFPSSKCAQRFSKFRLGSFFTRIIVNQK